MNNNNIITIKGKEALKKDCRKIKGIFYFIGDVNIEDSGDCYFINGKYYKQNTGYVVFDHRIKRYVIKNSSLLQGIVKIKEKEEIILGLFSQNPLYNNTVEVRIDNKHIICMNSDILKNTFYLENLQSGVFHYRKAIDSVDFIRIKRVPQNYKEGLDYDSRNLIENKAKLYNKLYTPSYTEAVKKYGGVTKDLTFGLEFETIEGFVPNRICDKLGLIPLRDGSIKGLEYVTIPLQGKKGIQTIVDSLKELNKRTIFDDSCSLHLHIGNIPRTEEFILALFKMLILMEDKMYRMFPLYKKYNFGVKRKHYTKPFPLNETIFLMDSVINEDNIKKNFSVLYKYLSMGYNYSDTGYNLNNISKHPSDPNGTSKWNIRSR